MIIKVSKKMTNELNKGLKNLKSTGVKSSVNRFVYTERPVTVWGYYSCDHNDLFLNNSGDYDLKLITVIYNSDCYAVPGELSTKDLLNCAKSCKDLTLENFLNSVIDSVEI